MRAHLGAIRLVNSILHCHSQQVSAALGKREAEQAKQPEYSQPRRRSYSFPGVPHAPCWSPATRGGSTTIARQALGGSTRAACTAATFV